MFPMPRVEGATGGSEGDKPTVPATGVPAPAPVQPGAVGVVDAPAQPVDAEAEWNTRMAKERDAIEAKWKRDMAGLQSKLDSQYSRQLAERDREIRDLTSRLESDLLARMTPEERSAYEAESRTDKERRLQEELEQEKGARQAAISMINYAQRLTRLGVNLADLEFSDPDVFFREADSRFEEYIRDLRAKAEAAPAAVAPIQPAAPVPGRPTPPQVVTGTGTPPAQMTPNEAFAQLQKLYSEKAGRPLSEEEIWRIFETGQQDLNKQIPGLSTP